MNERQRNVNACASLAFPLGRLDLLAFKFHKKHLNQVMSFEPACVRLACVFHILALACSLLCDPVVDSSGSFIQLGLKEVSTLNLIWNGIHRVCSLDWDQIRLG